MKLSEAEMLKIANRVARSLTNVSNPLTKSDVEKLANRVLVSMACGRAEFKDKVGEKLYGGFGEFCKWKLACLNGFDRWRDHWETEWRRLVGWELKRVLNKKVKFKGKRKAAMEVLEETWMERGKFRSSAKTEVARDFDVREKTLRTMSEADAREFYDYVKTTIEMNLPEDAK